MEKKKLKNKKSNYRSVTPSIKTRPKVRNLTLEKSRGKILKRTAVSLMNNIGGQFITKHDYS